jgi:hypothetical protein
VALAGAQWCDGAVNARGIRLLAPWLLSTAAHRVAAQATVDMTHCDSIVAAARIDSVEAGLFLLARRVTGGDLSPAQRDRIVSAVATGFAPPHPFRLTVFGGGVQMRVLRPHAQSRAELRAPVLTGIYRVYTTRAGIDRLSLVRAALMPGFDSAAIEAIRWGGDVGVLFPPRGEDSMAVDIRFSSDSMPGARRIVSALFPRMPVVDALPDLGNPPPEFPADERADSTATGEVVFRFVVDRAGLPIMETVEVLRGSSLSFVKEAVAALTKQRFVPATIRGCPVAQQVEYPMTFVLPRGPFGAMHEPAVARGAPGGIDAAALPGP